MFNAIEAKIARELAKRVKTDKATLYDRLYGDRPKNKRPNTKIIDLLIHKLRQKLPKDTIQTVWGQGYTVTSDAAKILRAHAKKSESANA